MSRPARIAIVGCGNISAMHLEGIAAHPDEVVVVAGVDPSAERRAWARETWNVPALYPDVAALLADTSADLDAAVVSTPSEVRLEAVRDLAEAGIAMLVEKPLAATMEEAYAIADLARRTGTVLGVDQNFRDHYAFGLARDVVRSGEIGPVYGIDHRELVFREVTGWRAASPRHALSVMGVHWFDGFRRLLEGDALSISCTTVASPATPAAGETDAFVQVRFGAATVDYTQSFSSRIERVETVVFGERGTLRLDYDTLTVATAAGTRVERNPFAGDGKPQSAYRQLEQVLAAAAGGTRPENGVDDNLKTMSLLMGAYLAADRGEAVTFDGGLLR